MNFLSLLAVSAILRWDYSPADAQQYQVTHFEVYVGIQSVVAGNPPVMTLRADYPALQQPIDGMDYGTTYYFTIKAFGAGGPSPYSEEITYTPVIVLPSPTPMPTPVPTPPPTPTPVPTPPPPSNLRVLLDAIARWWAERLNT